MTESNQKPPLDLRALHTLYSGCTPKEKCELIERIWKLEEVVREYREQCPCNGSDICEECLHTDEILKGRP